MADSETGEAVEVMSRIRATVEARREQGELSIEDVELLVDRCRRDYGERAEIDPRLLRRLLHTSHDWNIDGGYVVKSHRQWPLSWLVRIAKLAVRPFVRLYTDHVVEQQAQINLYFYYFMQDAIRQIAQSNVEIATLRRRCDELARQ